MPRRVFIHANNVHQGGGRSLLLALLKAVAGKADWVATLDARLEPHAGSLGDGQIEWVARSAVQRLKSEWWLRRNVQDDDVLLCFGNLPPLFHSRGRVIVFVQNRYLIEPLSLDGHSVSVRLRIGIERWWLRKRALNVDLFIVQTPTMKSLLQSRIVPGRSVAVIPFVGTKEGYSRSGGIRSQPDFRYDFLYVASGEPHKNHRNLIEAWCLLAAAGSLPSLCLTIDEAASLDLCQWLRRKTSQFGLKVENVGSISHEKVQVLYRQTRAFVFASTFESLGLPLIEARQAGLPVLAPELDYVRDVLDPQEVFDPTSPVSIARAVNRFMGIHEEPLPLLDASGFVDAIFSSGEPAFPA